jgi:transcriptional regulator with GAF, ATPase, and Fis domain
VSTVSHALALEAERSEVSRVVVIEGPDAGKEFALDPSSPSRVLLGTSPACEMRLSDPTVSRRHAAFEPAGRRYKLTDFQSTNGTFVDGVAIGEAYVRGGEIVRCGSTAMRLEQGEAAPSPPLPSAMRFGRTLGASVTMRRLYPLCERLAKARVPVIIEGETGTGKEMLAESLHEMSGSSGPFVVFDCTTVSAALVEAELFGHERGAFTGAVASRAGVFEEANGGTLLIDEIGDLELPLQAKLLRAIDRGEVKRVGGQKSIKVQVRILSATRRDLDKAVAAGHFRDDLFHRLAVARIELPPLRERKGDVPLLARRFAQEMGAPNALSAEVLARFDEYHWPGNIRELRNAVARYIALGDDDVVRRSMRDSAHPSGTASRPDVTSASSASSAAARDWLTPLLSMPFPIARRKTLEEFERRYVEGSIAAHGGNVSAAARASGLALRYFRLVKARQQPG